METQKVIKKSAESFVQFHLKPDLLAGLQVCEYFKPFQVQERALTSILDGQDVFVESSEVSGKTALAIISALQLIDPAAKECQALILYPTRVLTEAASDLAMKMGRKMDVKVVELIGGKPREVQERNLKEGTALVIGTPGRVYDSLEQGSLRLKALKLVIVEECCFFIDMGFGEIMKSIFKLVPPNVQMCIFSSKRTDYVKKFIDFCLRNPVEVRVGSLSGELEDFEHYKFMVEKQEDKADFLIKLYNEIGMSAKSIIYCKKNEDAEELVRIFREKNLNATSIDNLMVSSGRYKSILKSEESSGQIFVTTDPQFLEGLDCRDTRVSLIINYDVPECQEDYKKNLGGEFLFSDRQIVVSIFTPDETENLRKIEFRSIKIEEVPFDEFVKHFKEK